VFAAAPVTYVADGRENGRSALAGEIKLADELNTQRNARETEDDTNLSYEKSTIFSKMCLFLSPRPK